MSGTHWVREAVALLKKDIRAELRTKTAVSAMGVFSFAALLLIAFSTATLRETRTTDVLSGATRLAWDASSKMGILWTLIFFAGFSGLSHSFVHEEETGTVTALRLRMAPHAVYAGKLAYNFVTIFAITAILTPLYQLITGMPLGSPFVFLIVMLSGCVGLAGVATIVAALAAKARNRGALFGALGLPLLLVFLILLINAAGTLFTIAPSTVRVVRDVGGLISYGVLIITLSALVFGYVWEE